MSDQIEWVALSVFIFFFALVTVMGFFAARWKSGPVSEHLDEWGLGGRQFGTWITWFLVGGDFYTAYTVIAVPALVYAVGAYGFFALPYTIIVYPFVFAVMPLLWKVAHANGHVTAADVVHGTYGSRGLELAVAITGMVATMPYIALQLIGMGVVIKAMGLTGELPIIAAFIILALYTYSSGLRAPALIAFVKDIQYQGIHSQRRGADAVQGTVPVLVRGLCIFGDCDRRAGAGGGHEHRRRQFVHPQCLEI